MTDIQFSNSNQQIVKEINCILCNENVHIDDYTEHISACTGSQDIFHDASEEIIDQPRTEIDDEESAGQPFADIEKDTADQTTPDNDEEPSGQRVADIDERLVDESIVDADEKTGGQIIADIDERPVDESIVDANEEPGGQIVTDVDERSVDEPIVDVNEELGDQIVADIDERPVDESIVDANEEPGGQIIADIDERPVDEPIIDADEEPGGEIVTDIDERVVVEPIVDADEERDGQILADVDERLVDEPIVDANEEPGDQIVADIDERPVDESIIDADEEPGGEIVTDIDERVVDEPTVDANEEPGGQIVTDVDERPVDESIVDADEEPGGQRVADIDERLVDEPIVDANEEPGDQIVTDVDERPVDEFIVDVDEEPADQSIATIYKDNIDQPVLDINDDLKKYCVLCSDMIDESEFLNHMMICFSNSAMDTEPKVASRKISFSKNADKDSIVESDIIKEEVKYCIICCKSINESEFKVHVITCICEEAALQPMKNQTKTCFSCHCTIDITMNLHHEISCHFHHIYCFSCIQHSMENFSRNHSTPLCHPTLCNYQLSRFDVAKIPLKRQISNQLLELAKGQQRPQCSKCQFYIHINNYEDYYEHVDECGELITCEYCSCPCLIDQLHIHIRQCRKDKTPKLDKLINFIFLKLKHPFTKEQIQIFIQERKKRTFADLNPLSIVESLADFGPIFPIEIPKKECDVCMKTCSYEDICVFDCPDSHKLCYTCYYRSCETKMYNGEILTCGLCTTPLQDFELSQLRISDKEKKTIQDYQIRKTLDDYSNHTHGIIKCPNQNCTWIAQAEDSTECFRVTCPLCKTKFCSLCNQQYHYRIKCQELPQITQQWFLWCETERTRYLTVRAEQDVEYAARLDEYNQQMNENKNRNRELRRQYDELMTDENYKIQHCRLCPSCNRVVQRLEGCDKMICGQDAHGESIQSSCGAKFNWAQAQPYTAVTSFESEQMIIDLPKPESPIVKHTGIKCDECKNDIIGIRFECIHCRSLTYCEKCEPQATLKHSKLNEKMKKQSHIFKLIMKS